MRNVSAAWRAETQKRILSPADCRITMGMMDVDAASDAHTAAALLAVHSTPRMLFDTSNPTATVASLEKGRLKLDGTQRVAERATGGDAGAGVATGEGLVWQAVSGADGHFAAAARPSVVFAFTKAHTVPSLTFTFDAVCGWWPARLSLRAWRGQTLLCTRELTPGAVHFIHRIPIENFDKLELTFLESGTPFRRARLQRLLFGELLVFTGRQLKNVTQKSVTDPTSRRMPESSVQFTLVNRNTLTSNTQPLYHPDNPQGVWRYLEEHSPLHVEFGQTLMGGCTWGGLAISNWNNVALQPYAVYRDGGVTEWVLGGAYHLSAQPEAEGLYASFEAVDLLVRMTDVYRKGVYAPAGETLYNLALAVLRSAALPTPNPNAPPWRLWEGLRNIKTTAPLPCRAHRECLQLIAHAACSVLYCDREGNIRIEPGVQGAVAAPLLRLPLTLQTAEPKTGKTQPLAAVSCAAYTYTPRTEAVQLYKAVHTVNGTLRLHLTYQSAMEVSAVLEDVKPAGKVTLQSLTAYAGAATVVLAGNGTASLLLRGRTLEAARVQMTAYSKNSADFSAQNAVTEELDNPLITEAAHAAAVAAQTRDFLCARTAYTITTAGHPEAETLDLLLADSMFTKECPVQVLQHTVEFDGSMRSTFITKRRETIASE